MEMPPEPDMAMTSAEGHGKTDLLVVGIGASAGGVRALQEFFKNVSPDPEIAYVVILHLPPDHESKLAEVLQVVTSLPVLQVVDKTEVLAGHIYVISPNYHLTMSDGFIIPSENMEEEDRRAPVDIFFRTLANSRAARAICVILSGTGANGSMGLKRVKESGGAAFVQDPVEAEFNEMPRHAIATGMIDEVLPVAEIPRKIISYHKNIGTVHIPVTTEDRVENQQKALRDIFAQLRARTGHDFSNYKRPTVLRRIERRINIRNIPDLSSYSTYLQQQPEEINALLKDLLISVTNFFRDKKAFDILSADVLTEILKNKKAEDLLRIWVAGCATGEEAYSIAMLCAEKTLGIPDAPKVQIFATDIDDSAIAFAREGLYTLNDAADVPPERLRRFFNKEGDGYRIRREVREMILFANHNIIKDPPFSHIDLVSCRNVFIYLNQSAQKRVMETFHFALQPGGFLFLGSSESADNASELYTAYNRVFHIFRTRQVAPRSYPVPESIPRFSKTPLLPEVSAGPEQSRHANKISVSDLHLKLLEQYAPPSILIDSEYQILHLSEKAGRYLEIAGGEPSQNLLEMVRSELRIELRSALYQAVQRRSPVEARGLKISIHDKSELVNIVVRPVFRAADADQGLILVVFERAAEDAEQRIVISSDEPVARHLEDELIQLKAQLRASVEQHEFQAEELKASNEELQAMNEELRSAAEELETSKEELQSINEELRTVNQEQKVKVEETTLASNNLQNLINSTDIGTVFLDRNFRVALFTPSARNLFNLIANDIGRPLSDITNKLADINIIAHAELVLEKLQTIEREVLASDGKMYLMRILPYRTEEDRINGVVITFVDISERSRAAEALKLSEERYRAALNSANMAAWDWDIPHNTVIWNEQHFLILGLEPDDDPKTAEYFLRFVYPDDLALVERELDSAIHHTDIYRAEFRIRGADNGKIKWMRGYGRVVAKEGGKSTRMVGVMFDITESKITEQQKDEFIGIASHELKTPVTSIKIYAEILEEQFRKSADEKSAELMHKMNIQVDRLTDLIENLLDTTRIAEGRLVIVSGAVDINQLITSEAEEIQRLTEKHHIILQPGKIANVHGDRDKIAQVLTNLLSNAIKYSPKGGNITISTENAGQFAKISVRDEGIGISRESQQKIFDRFFRINTSAIQNYPGMGLGLYISAGIVQRHGGQIGVESEEGRGSVFWFTIPYN